MYVCQYLYCIVCMSISSPVGSGEPVSLENLVVRKYVLESTENVILINQSRSLVLNKHLVDSE